MPQRRALRHWVYSLWYHRPRQQPAGAPGALSGCQQPVFDSQRCRPAPLSLQQPPQRARGPGASARQPQPSPPTTRGCLPAASRKLQSTPEHGAPKKAPAMRDSTHLVPQVEKTREPRWCGWGASEGCRCAPLTKQEVGECLGRWCRKNGLGLGGESLFREKPQQGAGPGTLGGRRASEAWSPLHHSLIGLRPAS